MDKDLKAVLKIFSRYLLIVLFGLGNLVVFYKILTPLTIKTTFYSLKIFSSPKLVENFIQIPSTIIEIVPACVAGAAFYLLFILVFSTADIKPKKRLKVLLFSLVALFALNILRILVLIPLANEPYFETMHWIFWHLISTLFVVGTWFLTVHIFKIKSIPIYSDIKLLIGLTQKKPKSKKISSPSKAKKTLKKRKKPKRHKKN